MSEEPKASEEKPEEAITDTELDDVAGGTVKSAKLTPIKDDDSFVSFPPQFIKVMSYHDVGATDSNAAKRSVSQLFDSLASDSAADE